MIGGIVALPSREVFLVENASTPVYYGFYGVR